MQDTLGQQAYGRLEEMIVTQALPPGAILSEAVLGRKLGFGRTPIREALQRLERDGLVAILPRRGVVVTEINLGHHLKLLETRRELERLVARNAARRASPAQRQRMRDLAEEIIAAAAADDGMAFTRAGREFHSLPVEAADNGYAEAALGLLHGLSRRFWHAYYRDHAVLTEAAAVHVDRLRAIASGDPDAAAAASDRVMDYLEAFARSTLNFDTRRSA